MWEKTRNLLIPALLLDLIDSILIGFRFKAESLHYYIQCNEIFILLLMGLKGDEEVRCWVSCAKLMMLVVMKKMMITMIMMMINIQRSIIKSTYMYRSAVCSSSRNVSKYVWKGYFCYQFLCYKILNFQSPDKCHLFCWKQQ